MRVHLDSKADDSFENEMVTFLSFCMETSLVKSEIAFNSSK